VIPKLARGVSLSQYISRASDSEFQQARDLFNMIDVDGKGRITSGNKSATPHVPSLCLLIERLHFPQQCRCVVCSKMLVSMQPM
jgi:hypothetical protein